MTRSFVHLHTHTEYSLLDGAVRCEEAARTAAAMGMPAVAMTDHGVMYGAVEFYECCIKAGVKPILGCEVYVEPDGHRSREKKGKNHHLILLAENQEGYNNLIRLVSIANTDGFYYKPRIDHELLSRYGKGLIASSACLAGEIPSLILDGRDEDAFNRAAFYRDLLGDGNFFLEVMHNGIPEQAVVNRKIVEIARKGHFPLVATNDVHYLTSGDYDWHEILLCVQTKNTIDATNRMTFSTNDFYFRSPEEMDAFFGSEIPEALDNTVLIAERCSVTLPLGAREYKLPTLALPDGETLDTKLEKDAKQGLTARFEGREIPPGYAERLAYELSVIRTMGFAGYFLIVSGIIQDAKDRGIPIGPGRGSAAGSLVAYSLRITELDPIRYDLLFERFLNPERISMPDIDTDVSDRGRDELLKSIVQKYGKDHVSQIITFGRMKSKNAILDVGRALGIPLADVRKVSNSIPPTAESIQESVTASKDLQELRKSDPRIARLLDSASHIEGLARHCSQHAAGVVITPVPLTDLVPIQRIRESEDQVVTQYSMEPVEKLGLVKMDFLGLKTLSVLEEALENIRGNEKTCPELEHIPLDDQKTYEMLQDGDTLGVFQLESSGMRRLLRKLRPDCFEDLVAVLALYRPGPLGSGMVDQYVERKHGRSRVEYLHPCLEPVLRETYGVVLYQEQVMQCAATMAGYSLGEADLLRRAMGKKKVEVMEQQRAKFVSGAVERGVEKKKAEEIFDIIQEFAGYGFNKSHSAAYALISYHTAFLKANFPSEFMAAYLSSQIASKKEVKAEYVREVRESGIPVLPPDINSSLSRFTAVGDIVRFGLGGVDKVGAGAVESIIESRRSKGPFTSLWDFISRVDLRVVNKAVIENLIRSGAFESIHANRRSLLDALPEFISMAQKCVEDVNQCSLFEGNADDSPPPEPDLPEAEECSQRERLEMEKDVMGLYISGHPFEHVAPRIARFATCRIGEVGRWSGRKTMPCVGGIVIGMKERLTKSGDPMGILELEDDANKIEAVCFPKIWPGVKSAVHEGDVCLVRGSLDERGNGSIIVKDISSLDEKEQNATPMAKISIDANQLAAVSMKQLYRILRSHPGKSPVMMEFTRPEETVRLFQQDICVSPDSELRHSLASLLSEAAFEIHV